MYDLPTADISRHYEITVLLTAGYTTAERNDVIKKLTAIFEEHDGEVQSDESWGVKELAYKITHNKVPHEKAYYHHFVVEMPTTTVNDLDLVLQRHDEVIRHLIIVQED
jgi:ribosomal protein S6